MRAERLHIFGKYIDNLEDLIASYIKVPNFLVLFSWFVISTLIIAVPFFSHRVNYPVGAVAQKSIFSPIDIEIETKLDKQATEKQREERAALVEDVYDIDPDVVEAQKQKIEDFFKEIVRAAETTAVENNAAKGITELPGLKLKISQVNLALLLKTNKNILTLLDTLVVQTLEKIMFEGVKDNHSLEIKRKINDEVSRMNLSVRYKEIIKEILTMTVENNQSFNLVATNLKKAQARSSVAQVKTRLLKNQPILYKNDKVTEQHIQILKDLGMYGPLFNLPMILAVGILNLLSILFLTGYLAKNNKSFFNNTRHLVLIVGFALGLLILARFLVHLDPLYLPLMVVVFVFTIVLNDLTLVYLLISQLVFFTAVIFDFNFKLFALNLFTALWATFLVRKITDRNDITKAGFYTAAGSVVIYWTISIVSGSFALTTLLISAIKLMAVSFFSAVFVLGILPYIEDFFKVVTPLKLLELSNPNAPLLKRLLIEAPGTYYHSIMVANLAEAAMEVIPGGNPLLARVASFYHDIGKIKRPYFFVENQAGLSNPHDNISLRLSVLIILMHIKDGVVLGRQYNLPQQILDIIAQHHGTDTINYFYHTFLQKHQILLKEKNNNKKDSEQMLSEDDFKYAGPKPQSREAAVVMLADSCEAAIRSLEKTSQVKIAAVIDKIIHDKLEAGQLNESEFSFQDLSRIKQAFMHRLEGTFHTRIEYPEEQQALKPSAAAE